MIMEIDEYIVSPIKQKEKISRALAEVYLFFTKTILPVEGLNKNVDVLFVKTMRRSDYNSIYDAVVGASNAKDRCVVDLQYTNRISILNKALIILKYLPIYYKIRKKNIFNWFFLISRSWSYLEAYEHLSEIKFNKLIVFSDMQPIDNLMVQLSNLNGKPTVSLQHGLYVDYEDCDNVNVVNYKNIASKYFLAWGRDTECLLKKYHNKLNVVVCGRPVMPLTRNYGNEYFTIVFDQNIFFDQNREILEIAYKVCKKMGLKVNLKLHPNNRVEWFKIQREYTLVDQDISKSAFVIGHTTTMIYECMAINIPSFRYKTHVPSNRLLDKLEFRNYDELYNILSDNEIMNLDFNKISKNYFAFTGKESIEKYKEFFEGLKNDEL